MDRLVAPPRAGHVLVFLRRRDVRGLTTTPPPVVLLGVRCGIFLFHGPTPNGCPLPIHVVNRGCPCDEPLCKEWRVPRAGTAYRHDTLWMDAQPGKMELRSLERSWLFVQPGLLSAMECRGCSIDPYHSECGGCFRWGFAPLLPFKPNKPNKLENLSTPTPSKVKARLL